MKYSLPFYVGNKYLDMADEIMIKYDADSESSLMGFLDEHPNQRVVLRIAKKNKMTDSNYQFLQAIVKQYAEGAVVIRFEELVDSGIKFTLPHFFLYYCNDIEQALTLQNMGVTDIYVTGNLCYQLKNLKEKIKCNIRVYPNWAQSSIEQSNPYTKFFIRPEDVKMFEPYIDYFEFYTDDVRAAADLYKVYCVKGHFEGDLSKIITGFPPAQIYNECIDPLLAADRLKCNKTCVYWGSSCKICEKWFHLAQTLYNKKYTIKLTKSSE